MVDDSAFGHIRSGDELRLAMDFSKMNINGLHPSDIDMFFLTRDGALLLVEIKNEKGQLKQGQKWLYKKLADSFRMPCLVLYATHKVDVHTGGKVVDVSQCEVQELYYNIEAERKWREPKRRMTVGQVFEIYNKMH